MKKYDIFEDFMKLQDKINKIFEAVYPQLRFPELKGSTYWHPDADIYESDSDYIIFIDLPGVDKNNINVKVEDNSLTIKAERKYEEDLAAEKFISNERKMGEFYRSFTLPGNCKVDAIKAKFDAGVLKITIPKVEKKKSKEVKIELK
jgi:HSP20 family protein